MENDESKGPPPKKMAIKVTNDATCGHEALSKSLSNNGSSGDDESCSIGRWKRKLNSDSDGDNNDDDDDDDDNDDGIGIISKSSPATAAVPINDGPIETSVDMALRLPNILEQIFTDLSLRDISMCSHVSQILRAEGQRLLKRPWVDRFLAVQTVFLYELESLRKRERTDILKKLKSRCAHEIGEKRSNYWELGRFWFAWRRIESVPKFMIGPEHAKVIRQNQIDEIQYASSSVFATYSSPIHQPRAPILRSNCPVVMVPYSHSLDECDSLSNSIIQSVDNVIGTNGFFHSHSSHNLHERLSLNIQQHLEMISLNRFIPDHKVIIKDWCEPNKLECSTDGDESYPVKAIIYLTTYDNAKKKHFTVNDKFLSCMEQSAADHSCAISRRYARISYIVPGGKATVHSTRALSISFAGKSVQSASLSLESLPTTLDCVRQQLVTFEMETQAKFRLDTDGVIGFLFESYDSLLPFSGSSLGSVLHELFPAVRFVRFISSDLPRTVGMPSKPYSRIHLIRI